MPSSYAAVLARIQHIEPQPNGGGLLQFQRPLHVFNGDDYWNHVGLIQAWCGAWASTVELAVVEDRTQKTALHARLCQRCFTMAGSVA